jgi:hypothetical protein
MKKLLIATLAMAVGLPVLAQTTAPMNSDTTMKSSQPQSMEEAPVTVPGASGTPIIEPSLGSGTSTTTEQQRMESPPTPTTPTEQRTMGDDTSSSVPSTDSSMGSGTDSTPQQSMEDSDDTSVSPNSTDMNDVDEDANLEEEE